MRSLLLRLDVPSPATADTRSRRIWAALGLLLAIHVLLAWAGRDPGVHVARDDARYLLLARSLEHGWLRDLYRPGAPFHTLYPPLYPVVLRLWGLVAGEGFARAVALNTVFSAATLLTAFVGLRRVTAPRVALACVVPLAVSPALVARAGTVRAEPLYMFLSMVSLAVLAGTTPSARHRVAALGSAVAAALSRINGVALLAAIGVDWLWARRVRWVLILAAASAATVGVWLAWSLGARDGGLETTYARVLGDGMAAGQVGWGEVLWRHGPLRAWRIFGRSLPVAFAVPTVAGTPIDNVLIIVVLTASLAAGGLVLFRRWRVAGLYLVFYGVLLFGWPYLRLRFFEPALPLLVPAAMLGFASLAGTARSSWRWPALLAASLLLTASAVGPTARHVAARSRCGVFDLADPPGCLTPVQRDFLRLLDVVRRETPPDAVLWTTMPEPTFYHTGRKAVFAGTVRGAPGTSPLAGLREAGVGYALITPNARAFVSRWRELCSSLAVVEAFPPSYALLRIEDSAEPASRDACESVLDEFLRSRARAGESEP